jgi:signal transduction histidine kinase
MQVKNAMKAALVAAALVTSLAGWAAAAAADSSPATAKEAEAMVKKGVAFIKANGKEKGYAAITDRDNKDFHDRDLYLAVHRMDGTCIAHGTNVKMVGKNFIEIKDIDGKEYIKERVEFAQSKPSFWTDYKFTNPVSRKIEPKTAYCERLDDTIVCGGIYKK